MLYDLYFDPDQRHNLISKADLQDVADTLRKSLEDWMRDSGDPLCNGAVPLPEGVFATDPDAFSPEDKPFLVGQ